MCIFTRSCTDAHNAVCGAVLCDGMSALLRNIPLRAHPPPLQQACTCSNCHALVQVLQFVHGIVAPLADVPVAELALQIYLQAAHSASEVARLEMIAYEFMEQVTTPPPSPPLSLP